MTKGPSANLVSMHIPTFRPSTPDWHSAQRIWDEKSNPQQLSNFGPLVGLLELRIAKMLNVDPNKVVAFSSGTDALSASVATIPGNYPSLVIPDFSFLASLRSAQLGFAGVIEVDDIDLDDWSLNRDDHSNNAYMPVCAFGASPKYLMEKFEGSVAVIDAAASLGPLPDLSSLSPNHAVCFSLHATKIFGSGEGGIGVFGTTDWALEARDWSNFGKANAVNVHMSGANGKLSEVQAAFHLSKIENAQNELRDWNRANMQAKEISDQLGLELAPFSFEAPNPYWILKLKDKQTRDKVEESLLGNRISTKRWWDISLSRTAGFKELSNSKTLRETTLGLPMFRLIKKSELEFIAEKLRLAMEISR